MPKTTPLICNFNAGEFDPLLDARSDIQKYYSGCRTLQNMVPLVEGGAKRMPGTKYVAEVKTSSSYTRLVAFNFSTTQTYILEFGALYIRVYKDGQQVLTAASEGADLVTNGNFSAGTSWTDKDSGTGTSAITGGQMVLVCPYGFPGDIAGREQAITTEAAATYKLYFDCIGSVIVRVGTTSGGYEIYTGIFADVTSQAITFVATGTTTYIGFYTLGTTNRYVDNVICKKQVTPSAVEVTTTYTISEIVDLKFAQSADTLYIVHPSHAPAKLTRSSHTAWTLTTINFQPYPSLEVGLYPAGTITPAATTGTNQAFEASETPFLDSDVDREIVSGTGRATIINVDDTNTVHADITSAFSAASAIATGSWYLSGSPNASCTPSKKKPIGAKINLTLTVNTHGWRAGDVGKYVYVNGGMAEILSITSDTVAVGKILKLMTATTADEEWTLEEKAWSATRGYPSAVCFFENRLCFACTSYDPIKIWRSTTDDYENFMRDPDDESASDEFGLVSGSIDKIHWIMGADSLFAGTASGVWKLAASTSGEAMTDTNVSARKQTTIGVKDLSPVMVSDALLFVSRSGMVVHQFTYQFDVDKWQAPDMTRLSRHITKGDTLDESGISDLAFQAEPYPILWAIRADGELLGMTYNTSEQVFAWFRVVTDGSFESVAVISQEDQEDQVWVVVNRTIGGATKRYVELFSAHDIYSTIADAFFVHSGITYNGALATAMTGLTHLEGEAVYALADGLVQGPFTVSSGAITLTTAATKAHIGLSYTSIVEPMKLHSGSQVGTARGKKQKIDSVTICTYECGPGMECGSSSTNILDVQDLTAGSLITDDLHHEFPGDWDDDATVYIRQTDPVPMTIRALVPHVSLNEY